jgi:thymidylate synthase
MTYTFEAEYLDLLHHIMETGEPRADRTGTGTLATFGHTLMVDLADGFPMLTTKKLPFKTILSELLWFIEGSGDERRLAELLYGTCDPGKRTIWSANAEGTTGSAFTPAFVGDLGRVYGVQWRSWRSVTGPSQYGDHLTHDDGSTTYFDAKVNVKHVDQLADVIRKLRTNPTDRRIIMSAWNPGELDQMALPPCHMFIQFYLSNERKLHGQMYQRSVDAFLGLPFNIASYALLVHLIAQCVGAKPGQLQLVLGDTHIYKDHLDAVREQLTRIQASELPRLVIHTNNTNIDRFKMGDFSLVGYDPQPHIPAKMSA